MFHTIVHLNYLAVLVTAVVGFLLGWLWYSPVLFAKSWMAEMEFTEESMKAAMAQGMAKLFATGFLYTLLSSFGLDVLIEVRHTASLVTGAEVGAFVGLFLVGVRMLNASLWEQRSFKLQAITIGHEVVLFTLQGAILGIWNSAVLHSAA